VKRRGKSFAQEKKRREFVKMKNDFTAFLTVRTFLAFLSDFEDDFNDTERVSERATLGKLLSSFLLSRRSAPSRKTNNENKLLNN
jgi:hypothetical protein